MASWSDQERTGDPARDRWDDVLESAYLHCLVGASTDSAEAFEEVEARYRAIAQGLRHAERDRVVLELPYSTTAFNRALALLPEDPAFCITDCRRAGEHTLRLAFTRVPPERYDGALRRLLCLYEEARRQS